MFQEIHCFHLCLRVALRLTLANASRSSLSLPLSEGSFEANFSECFKKFTVFTCFHLCLRVALDPKGIPGHRHSFSIAIQWSRHRWRQKPRRTSLAIASLLQISEVTWQAIFWMSLAKASCLQIFEVAWQASFKGTSLAIAVVLQIRSLTLLGRLF